MRYALTVIAVVISAGYAAAAEGITKEAVTLTTDDGVSISAYFVKGAQQKGPAVVLLHMLGRSKEDWDPIIEKYLAPQAGFSYLAIDLRGHGASTKQGDRKLAWKDFNEQDFNNMTRDVAAAVKWLRERKDVDADKIGVVGASIGANVALNYAAGDAAIKCVAMLSPGLDYRGVKTGKTIKTYTAGAVFIAAAREDVPAGADSAALGKAAAAKKRMAFFDGNVHGTRMFGLYELDKPLADFLKEYLK